MYVIRYAAQPMRCNVQLTDELEEREQTPLERSKRRRAEQDIKVSRSVKRLDDASAFVGREENLFTESKREVGKVCAVGEDRTAKSAKCIQKHVQKGAIERKMQRVMETHSVDRVHPSCYAIPT